MKLSIRATTGAKIFVVFFCAFVLCCGAAPLIALATQSVRMGPEGAGSTAVTIGAAVLFLAILAGLIWLAVSVMRGGVRLDGTILTVQKAFSSSHVDLATAPAIWFDERQVRRDNRHIATLPLLCVRKPDGKLLQVALATARNRLPPEELAALADAIERGVHSGTGPREAATIVHQLRTWSYRLPG